MGMLDASGFRAVQTAPAADDGGPSRAFVFPGQGSQAVGMGRALAQSFATARRTFAEVDDALGQDLSGLMADGPEAELTLTENAQPALMAVSLAVVRTLEDEFDIDLAASARFVAGHSLGEYSALTAAGGLEIADAARLLKLRGRAMQAAVPVGEGAMAALMGLDLDQATAVAAEAQTAAGDGAVCVTANDNAPGQVVVSGTRPAVEKALEFAAARGAKRSVLLPVSAPFHCPLMSPAAEAMAEALAGTGIREPRLPLIANVTAGEVRDPAGIRDLLVRQITGMVRWRESVLGMRACGIDTLVEIGAGKVLAGLAKRIDREMTATSVGAPEDVEPLAEALRLEASARESATVAAAVAADR